MIKDISDRTIGIFGAILGVVGLVLSIYFYFASITERRPIFLLDDTSRAVLASKGQIPQDAINISRSDGKPITQDLNIAKFYFWNQGAIPIKAEEILKPIRIHVENGEILSYKITNVSRDVVKVSATQLQDKSLQLSASILETFDGFSGQIVYEGPRNAKIILDGVIQGVGEIEFCSCVIPKKPWYFVGNIAFGAAMMFVVLREALKAWHGRKSTTRARIILLGLALILMIGLIADSFRRMHNLAKISAEPPASIVTRAAQQ